jgi:hypothetical protein
MTKSEREAFEHKIEQQAETEGWPTFRITVRVAERGEQKTINVAGRSARHARMSAVVLAGLSLRGETVECEVQQIT